MYLYLTISSYTGCYLLIFNQLFEIFSKGVRTSRLDQNAPHDFLCIPQLWEPCTVSVHPSAGLPMYLYLTISSYTACYLLIFNQLFEILSKGVRTSRLDQNAPHDFLCIPQLWEPFTVSVQPSEDLPMYLYLIISSYTAINIQLPTDL